MQTVTVHGEGWTKEMIAELYKTEAVFVAEFMGNPGVYLGMDKEQKEDALKLAYSLCVPAQPEPVKPVKQNRAAITPSTAEGAE